MPIYQIVMFRILLTWYSCIFFLVKSITKSLPSSVIMDSNNEQSIPNKKQGYKLLCITIY